MESNNNISNNLYYQPPMLNDIHPKKPEIILSKRDVIFAFVFLALSFVIVDFVFFHGFNLGFTIAFGLLFSVLTLYLFNKDNKVSLFSYICGALSLAGSVTLALYKDTLINTIMVFLVCALFSIYICGISGAFRHREGSWKVLVDTLKSVFISPFSSASEITGAYGRAMSKNKASKNVIIGIALSLPVLLVIIPLLISSDAAFENLIKLVMKNIGIYLVEIALAAVITPYMIFYAVSKKHSKKDNGALKSNSGRGLIQSSVTVSFLSVISVTYIIYLFSQLAYFFSAFSGILPAGYTRTASEYARRGFFEMFAICVINMVIIAAANILTKRVRGKIPVSIKALSTFILLFTVLILITAMQKMKLNIESFGLSKNRLLVSVFMLMIMLIILFYIVHIFLPKVSYMQPIIVICSAMFIALSFANIDNMVVRYNVNAYNEGRISTIDVDYIKNMSDSSLEYAVELVDCDNHRVSKKIRTIIIQKIRDDYGQAFNLDDMDKYDHSITYKPDSDFRSYNYSADKACRFLEEYYNRLSSDERKKLITQYQLDNGDYYYDEEKDIYEYYGSDSYSVYSYNEKTDMYELSDSYSYEYEEIEQ